MRRTRTKPEKTASELRTREVLLATGITHQILYRYMTLGLIEEARTTRSGQRFFSARAVPAIRLIQRLNQTGYTLRDIKEIFFKEGRLRNALAGGHGKPDAG